MNPAIITTAALIWGLLSLVFLLALCRIAAQADRKNRKLLRKNQELESQVLALRSQRRQAQPMIRRRSFTQ